MKRALLALLILPFFAVAFASDAHSENDEIPIDRDYLSKYAEDIQVMNLISLDDIHRAIKSDYNLFMWDFKHITKLKNGIKVDPKRFSGYTWIGPYPHEGEDVEYDIKRFRRKTGVYGGWGEMPM